VRWAAFLALLLVVPGCGSGSTQTVEVTTTVQETTTVEAPAPTGATTTTPNPAGNDPDDVEGQLDIRDLNGTRTGDLVAVSLKTYEPWSSNVLVGSPLKVGPNWLTIYYDADLDGHSDYRGRVIFAGGELSVFISGSGSQFEPIPVERPNAMTMQFVHPVDVFFTTLGDSSDVDIQIRAESFYNGQKDRAPDNGWIKVPFNP
jgi:hypothetical protein